MHITRNHLSFIYQNKGLCSGHRLQGNLNSSPETCLFFRDISLPNSGHIHPSVKRDSNVNGITLLEITI